MSKTEDALKEAFAGESQANRKYLAFAAKADQEGFAQVAKLFRAAAEAETVHAHAHLRALKGIRSTRENLQEAIEGETHEFKNMYPAMIESAKAEGHKEAERSFNFANEVEKFMPRCIRRRWTIWTAHRKLPAIMFARYAGTLLKMKRRKPARSAAQKAKCLKKWINHSKNNREADHDR